MRSRQPSVSAGKRCENRKLLEARARSPYDGRMRVGVLAAVLSAVGLATSGSAVGGGAPLYRLTFSGPLHADWKWPANPHNNGRRDTQAQDVLSGKGCGPTPVGSRWTIVQRTSGLPAQSLIIDFVYHTSTNPAKITDANYGGVPAADVQILLRFTAGDDLSSPDTVVAQVQTMLAGPLPHWPANGPLTAVSNVLWPANAPLPRLVERRGWDSNPRWAKDP